MVESFDSDKNFDPNIQSEDIAFKRSEMVFCAGCERANPPNRLECLYCGKPLPVMPEITGDVKLNLRKLELWESGWNVIANIGPGKPQPDIKRISQLLGREVSEISEHLDTALPLPIARVDAETTAELIAAKLAEVNLECRIVSDTELDAQRPPVRLKRIMFDDGIIVLENFNTGEVTRIAPGEIALIVRGHLMTSRTDILERKRRRGNTKVIDETATSSDEAVIDIYGRGEKIGYRIRMTGFDFSCLGVRLAMIATENMNRLIDEIIRFAPGAKVVEDFARVGRLLDMVWEIEVRKDSMGLQLTGIGKREFGSVATANNFTQFTKFSRLQRHLL